MNPTGTSLETESGSIRGRIGQALQQSRRLSILTSLLLATIVGILDYFSGYQIYWSIFYLIAILFALWNVGVAFALFIAAFSLTSWLLGDWAAGVVYPNLF